MPGHKNPPPHVNAMIIRDLTKPLTKIRVKKPDRAFIDCLLIVFFRRKDNTLKTNKASPQFLFNIFYASLLPHT